MGHFRRMIFCKKTARKGGREGIGSALAENWHMQNKFSSNFSNYGGNAIILLFCSLGARKYDVVDQF